MADTTDRNVLLKASKQMAENVTRMGNARHMVVAKISLGETSVDRGDLGDPAIPLNVENQVYQIRRTGETLVPTSPIQLPNNPCRYARIRARAGNDGIIAIGWSNAVTLPNGTNNTTAGIEMEARDDTHWIPLDNLNRIWAIASNTGDSLVWEYLK